MGFWICKPPDYIPIGIMPDEKLTQILGIASILGSIITCEQYGILPERQSSEAAGKKAIYELFDHPCVLSGIILGRLAKQWAKTR